MNRPYTVCHILCALDGKIDGSFMFTETNRKASAEYARIRTDYRAQAWLYGTTTTKEFTNFQKPDVNPLDSDVPEGDFAAETNRPLYSCPLILRAKLPGIAAHTAVQAVRTRIS